LIGQQFRVGLTAPIYTIASFTSPTQIDLDQPFGGITQSTVGYSIYQCLFTPPQDFHQFICLWDPAFNWQLWQDVQQSEINIWDAQRASSGNAYVTSFRDYTTSQVGLVYAPIQITGSGPVPVSGGVFTAPTDAIYTVVITTGGVSGTAIFKWSKNSAAYTTGVLTDAGGAGQSLQDGVVVSFPLGFNYILNDTFVIRASAIQNSGLPRYELWPHQQAAHVYPFLYEARPTDLTDPNAVLPRFIRGDVLLEMALGELALWPGPSQDKPNPYRSDTIAKAHLLKSEKMIQMLEVQDDNVWSQDLAYAYPAMAWAMATPLGDSRFLQSHAI
jgi:hypothetical protein